MKRILPVVVLGVLMGSASIAVSEEPESAKIEGPGPFTCHSPDGEMLEPKYAIIEGAYFNNLPADREDCYAAVDRGIALCEENTRFEAEHDNQKYAGCLPIFEKRARECADSFREQRYKCDAGGAAGAADAAAREGGGDPGEAAGALEGEGNWGLKSAGDSYVCTESGDSSATWTWAGRCAGGIPTGKGIVQFDDGRVFEGPFVDGKPNGRWVVRYPNGRVAEGPYVDGKQNGRWVWRYPDGLVAEGPYVDGKKNGNWLIRWPNGRVEEGPYVDGKKNGRWVWRYPDGRVVEGPYVDGKPNGRWVERHPDGSTHAGCWRGGEIVYCN